MAQEMETKDFLARIYTAWAPIEAAALKPKADGQVDYDDRALMHAMDLAIFRTQHRPARVTQASMQDSQRRAGMNRKYQQAGGDY